MKKSGNKFIHGPEQNPEQDPKECTRMEKLGEAFSFALMMGVVFYANSLSFSMAFKGFVLGFAIQATGVYLYQVIKSLR